jgi:hypothetical protein
MTIQVIGAGFGRTGTLSLKVALEQLRYDKCYHMTELFSYPDHVPRWLAATRNQPVDWGALYRGYAATVDWPSCSFWAQLLDHYPDAKVIEDEVHAIDMYLTHNETVKRHVSGDRLLVFEATQGWAPLCEFLERPIPDVDYPRVNTTEEFRESLR